MTLGDMDACQQALKLAIEENEKLKEDYETKLDNMQAALEEGLKTTQAEREAIVTKASELKMQRDKAHRAMYIELCYVILLNSYRTQRAMKQASREEKINKTTQKVFQWLSQREKIIGHLRKHPEAAHSVDVDSLKAILGVSEKYIREKIEAFCL